jgi:thioredoxin reductase
MEVADAIVVGAGPAGLACAATMHRLDLCKLLPDAHGVFDAKGMPLATGRPPSEPGLFFCDLTASPTGQLREIGIETQCIAHMAKIYLKLFAH